MTSSPTPYRDRIVEYCARAGIAVPKGFDASKSAEKYVVVDESTDPPTLHKRSTSIKKDLAAFLAKPSNAGKRLRVLDFKHCCELVPQGTGKFTRGASIDCISKEERRRADFMAGAQQRAPADGPRPAGSGFPRFARRG